MFLREAGKKMRDLCTDGARSKGNSIDGSVAEARAVLFARLAARRLELEQAILTRVHAISEPSQTVDPAYAEGVRVAVSSAVQYGLTAIERGEEQVPPIPAALIAQAQVAARAGVSLDTVLRRYFAGYTLLGDFLIAAAEEDGLLSGPELKQLLRGLAAVFDRLMATVGEEHLREAKSFPVTSEGQRTERVERLLAGELPNLSTLASELAYDFDGFHTAAVVVGPEAAEAVREFACSLDRRLLLVRRSERTAWAWFGGRDQLDSAQIVERAAPSAETELVVALGEAERGLGGWRLTHRQAMAALPIALRGPQRLVCYADVALLASVAQDELLSSSLRQAYLAPLENEHGGGDSLRDTLRAYFTAERNISSAAAALGVNRNTVANRLRAIEQRLSRSLASCAAELEVALRLDELNGPNAHAPYSGSLPHRT